MQEVWLKEVVFLAGAPAPPWTTLLSLALPARSRRQDVKRKLKYTVHKVQFRAGESPAHQVRSRAPLERRTKMATACPRAGRGHRTRCRCPRRRS